MRKLAIAAVLSAQLVPTLQPAFAADFATTQERRLGTFAGFRLRIPLDGNPRERQIRAGFAFAPTLQTRAIDGETRSRIGEGLEFGITGNEPARLSLAGTPVSQLAQGPRGPDGGRLGVSTLGWVAIGAGVVVVAVAGYYVWLMEATKCGPGEC